MATRLANRSEVMALVGAAIAKGKSRLALRLAEEKGFRTSSIARESALYADAQRSLKQSQLRCVRVGFGVAAQHK